jgi:hypothetical protein
MNIISWFIKLFKPHPKRCYICGKIEGQEPFKMVQSRVFCGHYSDNYYYHPSCIKKALNLEDGYYSDSMVDKAIEIVDSIAMWQNKKVAAIKKLNNINLGNT